MKILFWIFSGFDRHTTSEHLLTAILQQLCSAGHTVHILQKQTGGSLPGIPQPLSAYPVTTDMVPFQATAKGNFAGRYIAEWKYVRNCRKFLKPEYDAVFIQSNNVLGFAVRAVRRVLPDAEITVNVQDIFPYNAAFSGKIRRNGLAFPIFAAIQRYGYHHADHVVTISEDMKDTLVADGTADSKIDVIYNWSYQDEVYRNVDLRPMQNVMDSRYFNVVYAGNIGVMQNVDVLIEAARLLKEDDTLWFHIFGEGLYKKRLEAKARAYGIERISFWPMRPPEQAPAIYSAASVNVIPLVQNGYKTALPSKTATCLACGKPVIFAIGKESRFGQKIMQRAGCPVVESNSPEELAAAIKKVQAGYENQTGTDFFSENCSMTKNSCMYAGIITNGQEEKR